MAPRRCHTCNKAVVDADTRDGRSLELVKHTGPQLWGLTSEGVSTPSGRLHVNVAFKAIAYVEHECAQELETLAAEAKVIEFPSIGDPIPDEERVDRE